MKKPYIIIAALALLTGCATTVEEPQVKTASFGAGDADAILADINPSVAYKVCMDTVDENATLILDSEGGYVISAFYIADCVQKKNIKLVVRRAWSIAPVIAMLANSGNVCLEPGADIATHTPYSEYGEDVPTSESRYRLRLVLDALKGMGLDVQSSMEFVATMLMADSANLALIPNYVMERWLGSRYAGQCQQNNSES